MVARDMALTNEKVSTTKPTAAPKKNVKFRKAPQAPKKGKSAFILFSIAKHPSLRKQLDDGTNEKVSIVAKRVSKAWHKLGPEERAFWEKEARKDKMRYEYEKKIYTGPWKLPSGPKRAKKDPDAPRRPMSAFLAYSKNMRSQVRKDNPNLRNIEISKVLADMWKAAPEDERRIYTDHELIERKSYNSAIEDWRRKRDEVMAKERMRREKTAMEAVAHDSTQSMFCDDGIASDVRFFNQPDLESSFEPERLDPAEDPNADRAQHGTVCNHGNGENHATDHAGHSFAIGKGHNFMTQSRGNVVIYSPVASARSNDMRSPLSFTQQRRNGSSALGYDDMLAERRDAVDQYKMSSPMRNSAGHVICDAADETSPDYYSAGASSSQTTNAIGEQVHHTSSLDPYASCHRNWFGRAELTHPSHGYMYGNDCPPQPSSFGWGPQHAANEQQRHNFRHGQSQTLHNEVHNMDGGQHVSQQFTSNGHRHRYDRNCRGADHGENDNCVYPSESSSEHETQRLSDASPAPLPLSSFPKE